MDLNVLYEVLSKYLLPILLAWVGYVHNELNKLNKKHDELLMEHFHQVARANKEFATREVVSELENKVTALLNRIDDKVTRILEEHK